MMRDSDSTASFRNTMKGRRLLDWSQPCWKSFAICMNECIYKRLDKSKVKKEVKNVTRTCFAFSQSPLFQNFCFKRNLYPFQLKTNKYSIKTPKSWDEMKLSWNLRNNFIQNRTIFFLIFTKYNHIYKWIHHIGDLILAVSSCTIYAGIKHNICFILEQWKSAPTRSLPSLLKMFATAKGINPEHNGFFLYLARSATSIHMAQRN